jgi:hypothetical protein
MRARGFGSTAGLWRGGTSGFAIVKVELGAALALQKPSGEGTLDEFQIERGLRIRRN